MNLENLDRLISALKTPENRPEFAMFTFGMATGYRQNNICGTAGCIAGQCHALLDPEDFLAFARIGDFKQMPSVAGQKFLGLTAEEAGRLFIPMNIYLEEDEEGTSLDPYIITTVGAIKVLEHLRDTGEISFLKGFTQSANGKWVPIPDEEAAK